LHNPALAEHVASFELILVGFEEKIVETGTIFDEKSAKNGQKFPLLSAEWSFAGGLKLTIIKFK